MELQVHPGKVPRETLDRNLQKSIRALETLIAKIRKGERDKPSLKLMIPFYQKFISKRVSDKIIREFD